jgi:hypothetical protein
MEMKMMLSTPEDDLEHREGDESGPDFGVGDPVHRSKQVAKGART